MLALTIIRAVASFVQQGVRLYKKRFSLLNLSQSLLNISGKYYLTSRILQP